MSLHRAAAIAGIGETPYEKRSERSAEALQFAAALEAIADAGLSPATWTG